MLSTISLFILLLVSSHATKTSSFSPRDISQRRAGCHDRSIIHSETIIFRNGSQTAFDYKIITQYKKYYPTLLKYALRANGFEIMEWQSEHMCGWYKGDSVYGQLGLDSANHRGDIYWKYSYLLQASPPTNTSKDVSGTMSPNMSVSPPTGRPPNATTLEIRRILILNPPAGDVFELITIILGYGAGSMLFVVLFLLLKSYLEHEQRSSSTSMMREMEGVELEASRPLEHTSASSACRSTVPADLQKPLDNGDRDSFVCAIGTTLSELPPSYSASRAHQ